MGRLGAGVPAEANLERSASTRSTPYRRSVDRACSRLGLPLLRRVPTAQALRRPSTTRGWWPTSARSRSTTARSRRSIDIKDPVVYTKSRRWPTTPTPSTIFYTTDNHEYRDLRSGRSRDRRSREPCSRTCGSASWPSTAVDRRSGVFDTSTESPPWSAIPHPYDDVAAGPLLAYGEVYDLDISPDGSKSTIGLGRRDQRSAQSCESWRSRRLLAGEVDGGCRGRLRHDDPANFVFSPDGRYLYGSSYYTGVSNIWRYELATERSADAVTNTDGGFFRPISLGDDELIVFRYTGEGFVPARSPQRPGWRTSTPSRFSASRSIEKPPTSSPSGASAPPRRSTWRPRIVEEPSLQLSLVPEIDTLSSRSTRLSRVTRITALSGFAHQLLRPDLGMNQTASSPPPTHPGRTIYHRSERLHIELQFETLMTGTASHHPQRR